MGVSGQSAAPTSPVGDIFDTNKYAHDPRSDFLNWSLIDAGTFDYAAEAWGYSLGGTAEWYQGAWALRGGVFDMSIVPNSTDLDPQFGQFQWIGEIEHRHEFWGQPGKIAVTGFLSRGRMGSYQDAIQLAQFTGEPADIGAVRQYRSRGGALETYYSFPVSFCRVTLDYQFIVNPAYNRDRGPVSVFATRLHTQF